MGEMIVLKNDVTNHCHAKKYRIPDIYVNNNDNNSNDNNNHNNNSNNIMLIYVISSTNMSMYWND